MLKGKSGKLKVKRLRSECKKWEVGSVKVEKLKVKSGKGYKVESQKVEKSQGKR